MTTRTETDLAPERPAYRPGPHWFALLATIFTWPLLFVGGLVTTYKVGMAVPDWPTTFGINMFLYDMTKASWAVFGEHTHRLYGAAVGLFTLLLMLDFWIFDRRGWIKRLGVIALLAVVAQGVLGGLRVAGTRRGSPRSTAVSARRFSASWSRSACSPGAVGCRRQGLLSTPGSIEP